MPEPAKTDTTKTESTIDPFVAKIAASMQAVMKEDGTLAPIEPAKLDTATATSGFTKTISDVALDKLAEEEEKKKKDEPPKTEEPKKTEPAPEPKKEDAQPPATPAPAAAPAPAPPAAKKEDEPAKVKVEPSSTADLQRQLEDLRKTVAAQPAPPAPAPEPKKEEPKPDTDQAYIDGLTDEQKEELEFARFAEKRGHPDQFKKMLAYYRKVDAWGNEHPDASPESEEFRDFVKSNKPQFRNPNTLRMEQIEERVAVKAEEKSKKETEELRRRLAAIELRPKIDAAVKSFETLLASPGQLPLPEGTDPVLMDVAETVRVMGVERAMKDYPIETPIYLGSIDNAREYINLVNNQSAFNPEVNPVHRWLEGFIRHQEDYALRNPSKREGRTFVRITDYAKLPPAEKPKHWTFDDQDILFLIASNAHMQADGELKRLESAYGFKRAVKTKQDTAAATKKEAPKEPPAKKSETTETPPSPKGGSSALPGAAVTSPSSSAHAGFLDRLMPGASKIV